MNLISATLAIASLRKQVKDLEEWKEHVTASTPDWQKIGEALDMKVGESVPQRLLEKIWVLKNEVEMWKIQAKMVPQYSVVCACEWFEGKVVGLCAAHNAVVIKAEDRLAEKYQKLTGRG